MVTPASHPKALIAVLAACLVLPLAAALTPATGNASAHSPDVNDIILSINESFIEDSIAAIQAFGPHPTGSEACTRVRDYLTQRLEAWGLEVYLHGWSRRSYQGQNIVATWPGIHAELPPVVVSAHYDSAPGSPGADDDGSGVASVLAAARALREYSFNRTVAFVLFSGEEQGTLGSLSYVHDLYHQGKQVAGVINLDGIGHTETESGGRNVIIYEEPASAWLADAMEEVASDHYQQVRLGLKRLPNTGYSDHNSFLTYGYGALQVEEYEYNHRFHTANDTLDYVNVTYVTHIARLTAGTLARVAHQSWRTPEVTIAVPRHDVLYVFGRELLPLDRGTVLALGPLDMVAEASADTASVTFYLDGEAVAVDEEPPFSWTCRRTLLWDHQMVAEARDAQGNVAVAQVDLGLSLY
ncbi:MAG: M20/M25/M40 family metallo-hydrolase [Candidatus Thermoplasmatota archaeon]|nr:M20/M25/M40 family metallo-hydrolase [Candidatus Thermoplasmatota archaeon]